MFRRLVEKMFDYILSTSTLIFALSFLLFKYILHSNRKNPRLVKFAATLPGPSTFPVIGNGLEFILVGMDGIERVLSKYSRKYGTRYRLWFGKNLIVLLSDINDLEDLFRSTKTAGKPDVLSPVTEFWGHALVAVQTPIWKKTRKGLLPIFTKVAVRSQISKINEAVYKYMEPLSKYAGGGEFDIFVQLRYAVVDIITMVYFNLELDAEAKSYFDFYQIAKETAVSSAFRKIFMPHLRIKFIDDFVYKKRLSKIKKKLKEFVDIVVKANSSSIRGTECAETSILGASCKSYYELVSETEKRTGIKNLIFGEISVNIVTPAKTLISTISFILVTIAMFPQVQDALMGELNGIFGNDTRYPTQEDVHRLTYLDQVVKECERILGVDLIPILFKKVNEDCKIGSSVFPAGTTVMVNLADIHYNPTLYPDPYTFNPDNFSHEAIRKRAKHSFLTFSSGPRNCIGVYFADMAIKLTIISVLRHFILRTSMPKENLHRMHREGNFPLSLQLRSG